MTIFKTDSTYYLKRFGKRIQKIPIHAGFTCPNRDGSKSKTGCTYCNNRSFTPFYANSSLSIEEQLQSGISFFSKRYKTDAFLAYFQSYSCTYNSIEKLRELYTTALNCPGVIGLVISTRPDCLESEKISLIQSLSQKAFVKLEIGVESLCDEALKIANRQHTVAESLKALEMLKRQNILFGIHLIATLPGDSRSNFLNSLSKINQTSAKFIKLHHLQIVKNTIMAKDFSANRRAYNLFSCQEYTEFMSDFIARLSPEIYIERFINRVPPKYLIAPIWHSVNENGFRANLESLMMQKNLTQGCLSNLF